MRQIFMPKSRSSFESVNLEGTETATSEYTNDASPIWISNFSCIEYSSVIRKAERSLEDYNQTYAFSPNRTFRFACARDFSYIAGVFYIERKLNEVPYPINAS